MFFLPSFSGSLEFPLLSLIEVERVGKTLSSSMERAGKCHIIPH